MQDDFKKSLQRQFNFGKILLDKAVTTPNDRLVHYRVVRYAAPIPIRLSSNIELYTYSLKALGQMKSTTPPASMRQALPFLLLLGSAVMAVAAYLQALNYPFISDDIHYITDNVKLLNLHFIGIWRFLVEPYNPLAEFLPLRDFSYWLDITLFGLTPPVFRVHNIILYLLCLPLVYVTTLSLWRYFRPTDSASAPWAAAIVTALFSVNPAHAEAVVWISGRKDVLSGMFSMLALWLAVHAKREQGLSSRYATATLLALMAALLSKATAVAVAPIIAMIWIIFWLDIPAHSRQRSLLLWPLAAIFLSACMAIIFAATISSRVPLYFGIETVTRALAVLGWLVRFAVSPESRHFFHPVFEDPFFPLMVALGAATLAAAIAGVVMALRQRSIVGFSLAAFAMFCMPYLQLFPYAPPSLISDRFLFLAVWPVILLIVALAWRLNPLPRTVLLLAIALPWIYQTVERPRDWYNMEKLMDADLRTYPGHYIPTLYKISDLTSRGLYLEASEAANNITAPEIRNITFKIIQAGYAVNVDAVSSGKPNTAMSRLWSLGLSLKQPPVETRWNMSMLNFWQRCQKTLTTLWNFLAIDFPEDESVHYNAGLWLLSINQNKDAAMHLRIATESRRLPESARGTAFKNLGLALLNSGHAAEAEIPLRAALEQSPPDLRANCLLSEVYKQTKRIEEAVRAQTDCP